MYLFIFADSDTFAPHNFFLRSSYKDSFCIKQYSNIVIQIKRIFFYD